MPEKLASTTMKQVHPPAPHPALQRTTHDQAAPTCSGPSVPSGLTPPQRPPEAPSRPSKGMLGSGGYTRFLRDAGC